MELKLFQLNFLFLICFQFIYASERDLGGGLRRLLRAYKNHKTPKIINRAETLQILLEKEKGPKPPAQAIGMVYKLPPEISVGKYLKIEGFAPPGENRFEINLQKGSNVPTGDRDFHLSVKFDTETIVFNTLKNKKWQAEQVETTFPLDTGEMIRLFDITITLEEDFYKIVINDFQYNFAYRIPLEEQHLDFLVISPSFWVTSLQLGSNF